MFKGLDKLGKEFKEAGRALSELDGELGSVSFDAQDPQSIEVAIQSIHQMIDERVGRYASNKLVAPMVEGLKERYRLGILEKAAEARLKAEED